MYKNQIDETKFDINAEIGNTVTKLDYNQMHKCGWDMTHFIEVAALGYYGFTGDIITAMKQYEIFPKVFSIYGKLYVRRVVIFGAVQQFLENTMQLYRSSIEAEEKRIECEKYIAEHPPVKVTAEDIASGHLSEIIEEKQAALNEGV